MGDLSEHFNSSEFKCPHCGELKLSSALIEGLEKFRKAFNRPVKVHSGYRCAIHNTAVGGQMLSQHIWGTAADVSVAGASLQDLYDAAVCVPEFKGIGVYDGGFIHVDTRNAKARWARVAGKYTQIQRLIDVT